MSLWLLLLLLLRSRRHWRMRKLLALALSSSMPREVDLATGVSGRTPRRWGTGGAEMTTKQKKGRKAMPPARTTARRQRQRRRSGAADGRAGRRRGRRSGEGDGSCCCSLFVFAAVVGKCFSCNGGDLDVAALFLMMVCQRKRKEGRKECSKRLRVFERSFRSVLVRGRKSRKHRPVIRHDRCHDP